MTDLIASLPPSTADLVELDVWQNEYHDYCLVPDSEVPAFIARMQIEALLLPESVRAWAVAEAEVIADVLDARLAA